MVQGYTLDSLIANTAYKFKSIAGDLLFAPLDLLFKLLPSLPLPEVFPGVHLPLSQPLPRKVFETVLDLNPFSNVRTVLYGINPFHGQLNDLQGKRKGSLNGLSTYVQTALGIENVTTTFKFFGARDRRLEHLILLLKTNAFFAFALTRSETHGGFELKAFDPDDKNPSLFLKLMRTMTGVGRRVNFEFTADMKYKSHAVYDDISGAKVPKPDLTVEEYACSALYNMLFFASSVHTTIHVLHFLLTSAFTVGSENFREMNQWAEDYDENIGIKYIEVGQLLIKGPAENGEQDLAVITGPDGFGSSQESRQILKDLLIAWVQYPTAEGFLGGLMNISPQDMEKGQILTEFMKHYKLVKPFASDAAAALKSINGNKFDKAQNRVTQYLKDCGDLKSNISSIQQLLELLAISGMTHGNTLSYTRLVATTEVTRWRKIQNETWDYGDIQLISVGLGTSTGMEPGRHVMSSSLRAPLREGKVYAEELQAVLDNYDGKATSLKKAYEENIKRMPNFDDDGFILTDYCTDGFDGKQLTNTTYI